MQKAVPEESQLERIFCHCSYHSPPNQNESESSSTICCSYYNIIYNTNDNTHYYYETNGNCNDCNESNTILCKRKRGLNATKSVLCDRCQARVNILPLRVDTNGFSSSSSCSSYGNIHFNSDMSAMSTQTNINNNVNHSNSNISKCHKMMKSKKSKHNHLKPFSISLAIRCFFSPWTVVGFFFLGMCNFYCLEFLFLHGYDL